MLEPEKENFEEFFLIQAMLWSSETWQLSPLIEVYIKKTSTLHEFGEIVAKACEFEGKELKCTKIASTWNFHRV